MRVTIKKFGGGCRTAVENFSCWCLVVIEKCRRRSRVENNFGVGTVKQFKNVSSLFCNVTQRRNVVSYRSCGSIYRSHFQRSNSLTRMTETLFSLSLSCTFSLFYVFVFPLRLLSLHLAVASCSEAAFPQSTLNVKAKSKIPAGTKERYVYLLSVNIQRKFQLHKVNIYALIT